MAGRYIKKTDRNEGKLLELKKHAEIIDKSLNQLNLAGYVLPGINNFNNKMNKYCKENGWR
ncbi:hypothetical protein HOD20_04285 [archaeon]|nr:hypothetical protein [archaeon]